MLACSSGDDDPWADIGKLTGWRLEKAQQLQREAAERGECEAAEAQDDPRTAPAPDPTQLELPL